MTAEVDENGNRTEHQYDDAGRRSLTRDALLNETTFAYDADGNLVSQTDANGNTTAFVYDSLDRRTDTVFADNSSMLEAYDAVGRVTRKTDAAGVATDFEYDALGRLTAVVDTLGQRTAFSYDETGNKLTQTDANGNTTRWTYDALGRVLSRTLPLGQQESFGYDANGNLTGQTDFNSATTGLVYDINDRLVNRNRPDGSSEQFSYDAVGNRTQAVQTDTGGGTRTQTWAHDNRDRLIQDAQPDGTLLDYQYDAVGNRTQLSATVPGQTARITGYTFDALNRLDTVTDADGSLSTYGYDAVGNRAGISYGNGTSTDYTYDALNRLTQLRHLQGASVLQQYDYTLDATGRRTRVVESSGRSVDYSYDALYRLTQESITDPVNGNATNSYQYDPVGNRISGTEAGVTTAYTYDANDRLTQQGGSTYTYDANGNTLTETLNGQTTSYTYDPDNRLISVDQGGAITAYAYNVNGIRTQKADSVASTLYAVDENRDYAQVLAEIDGSGVPTVQYTYGDDLVSQHRRANTHFYHYDGLGSTRALSDASGTLTDGYDYAAFGELLQSTGTTENSYRFTGEQFDGTLNQYYLRARYYDQGVGRFTQMDTFQGIQNEPVTLHKYLYGNVDPANVVDPSGNFGLGSFGVSFSIQGALTTASVASSAFDLFSLGTGGGEVTAAQAGMVALASVGGYKLFKVFGKKFLNKIGCNSPNSKKPICKIFQSDKRRVDFIRKNLLVGVKKKKRRTVAFADYFGQSTPPFGTMWAVSGAFSPVGSEPVPVQPMFHAFALPGDLDTRGRDVDAEKKLFESLARKFSPGSKGIVRMHADRLICDSCSGVKRQFKSRYPGVIVIGPR